MNLRRLALSCLVCGLSACSGKMSFDLGDDGNGGTGAVIGVGGSNSNAGGAPGSGGVGVASGGASSADGGTVDGGDSTCLPGTWVTITGVYNVRDLGGVPLFDGSKVACGTLFRGAALTLTTSQGCVDFERLGIRTVIDLRVDSERQAWPDSPCVTDQASTVLAPLPVPSSVSPADYLVDLNTTASVAAAFNALGDESAYPIFIHCTWGRDRTGILSAIILLALGATRDDVMTEYLLSGSVTGGVGAYPVSLNAVLDDIEQRGGVEAYLADAGVSTANLAALRTRAIAR